jgi:hypothetical protein
MVTTGLEDRAFPTADPDTPAAFFAGCPEGIAVYSAVRRLLDELGPVEERVTRSHVAFVRGRGFAYLWRPGRWLRRPDAEVVLSFALDRPLTATRIKEVVHPAAKVWIHHVELHRAGDVDAEVAGWLAEAHRQAIPRKPGRRSRRAGR